MAYFEKKYDSSVKQEMQNINKFSKQEGDCMDLGLRAGQSSHFYSDSNLQGHRNLLCEYEGQYARQYTAWKWSSKNIKDNFMTQEVWNSTKEDAVSDIMVSDRGKFTQNVKKGGNVVTGPISSSHLA